MSINDYVDHRLPSRDGTYEKVENKLGEWFESDRFLLGLTVGPALLLVLGAAVVPVAWALALSLHEVHALDPTWTWVGLENHVELLTSDTFWSSFQKSFVFGFGSVALQLVAGVVVALLLSKEYRGVILSRALLFLPYLIPTIVVGMVFRLMMNGEFGIINQTLIDLGIISKPIIWLGNPDLTMFSVTILNSWKFSIFVTLMILARLQSIPDQLYEAATMNGAGPLRKFRDVTFPQIKGVILLVLLLRGIWMFNKFDILMIVTGGGPGNATTTLPILVYNSAFLDFSLGQAGAISSLLFAFIGIGALVYFEVFNPAQEVGQR